jgi:hypothetical protein
MGNIAASSPKREVREGAHCPLDLLHTVVQMLQAFSEKPVPAGPAKKPSTSDVLGELANL